MNSITFSSSLSSLSFLFFLFFLSSFLSHMVLASSEPSHLSTRLVAIEFSQSQLWFLHDVHDMTASLCASQN